MAADLQEILSTLLDDPAMRPDPEWVASMARSYPAFLIPAALMLRRCPDELDSETGAALRARVMLGCPDRTAMADLADIAGEDWKGIYPPEPRPQTPSTDNAIDTFLDNYGQSSPEENQLLERLIFNPVPADYFQVPDGNDNPSDDTPLLPPELNPNNTAPTVEDTQEQLSVPTSPVSRPQPAQSRHIPAEDSLLSESLAKIFIKQRRYERAYEIISNLSLKFPEKSIYFADQMRFLQKLIYNQQRIDHNNQQ